jgi:thiol-disulfide isomerase/thioredoxin
MGSLMPPVDVNSMDMLGEVKKRIAKGPLTMIFVYADWCGHCQNYKSKFAELEALPNRSMQIARVRDDVFPSLGVKNGEIDGYPSVIAVTPQNKAINFKDSQGNSTNTVPDHNDITNMKKIVMNGIPSVSKAENSNNVSRPISSELQENMSIATNKMYLEKTNMTVPVEETNSKKENNLLNDKNDTPYSVSTGSVSEFYNTKGNIDRLRSTSPQIVRGGCGCRQKGGSSAGLYEFLKEVSPSGLLGPLLSPKKTRKQRKRRV